MDLKPVGEQVVVICGASSGIGRAAALLFAARGAKVIAGARNEEGLHSLVEAITRNGGDAAALPTDVTSFEQVKALADQAVARYGRLDTWVHAAAVSIYALFEETTPAEFARVIEVNLLGQVHGARAALPHLRREGRGALIHISSIEARVSLPYQSAYAASKHAIAGFLDALRLELRHEGISISVTNIMPAAINTPLFNHARSKLGVKPMGLPPFYQPDVVAEAIVHAAGHPTGDLIVGDAALIMAQARRFTPSLLDAFLLGVGFRWQKTEQPEPPTARDNLYAPMAGYNTVKGDFDHLAQPVSLSNWLRRRPLGHALGMAATVAAAALMKRRLMPDRE